MKEPWRSSNTLSTKAKPEAIWRRWADVAGWPEEDKNLEWARLEGDFAVGGRVVMKPKGAPKSMVVITEMIPGKSYATEGKLPLCNLGISHKVEINEQGLTSFTHTISFHGPLQGLFVKLLGKKLANSLPEKMQNIARLAETA